MMVLEGRIFGKLLGHDGGALMNGISALMKRGQKISWLSFCHVRMQQEERHL